MRRYAPQLNFRLTLGLVDVEVDVGDDVESMFCCFYRSQRAMLRIEGDRCFYVEFVAGNQTRSQSAACEMRARDPPT